MEPAKPASGGLSWFKRISTSAGLREMLDETGFADVEAVTEAGSHPLNSPEDWWRVAMGSGYRGTLAQLDAASLARVRNKNVARRVQGDDDKCCLWPCYQVVMHPRTATFTIRLLTC